MIGQLVGSFFDISGPRGEGTLIGSEGSAALSGRFECVTQAQFRRSDGERPVHLILPGPREGQGLL